MVTHSNRNGHGRLPLNKECALREQIFALFNESDTTIDQDLEILSQCISHIRNCQFVEEIANTCGLKLSGFLVDDTLELYYDIKRGRHDMGNISKGWEDPGFRLGELITIPKSKAARFKANVRQIREFCATNGITVTVKRKKDSIDIYMDGVIYCEGFNKETFTSTLETLNECVEKVEELIGAAR